MFSRVQSLDQLNIVDVMDPSKITVNDKVMAEAARMWKVSRKPFFFVSAMTWIPSRLKKPVKNLAEF